jgi:REP element-mobilizing transposase RayT
MLLDNNAKEILRKHLHQAAEFSGVEIITYALMSNHFHVLVRVPEQGVVSDTELLRRYKILHPKPTQWATMQIGIMENVLKEGGKNAQKMREQFLRRMNDLSEFMKTFKHRFAVWFNKSHKRFGHLWAERFTSTIVEGNHHFALQMVAAYVDLNPLRAGIVKDPKDYRWSGYGEAVGTGDKKRIAGLRSILPDGEKLDDASVLAAYRIKLFAKGSAPKRGDSKAAKISVQDLENVAEAGGDLSATERLQTRMSWFTWGAVIGGKQFVADHLNEYRQREKRRIHLEPRQFEESESNLWQNLFTMRRRG